MIGIYKITNLINGKKYYGSSVDIKARWSSHKSKLRKNKHGNIHLQRAWDRYGKDNFEFEILLLCEKFELEYYEQWFLDNVVRWGTDYNINPKAEKPPTQKGRKHTEETKNKISIAHKGKTFSEEHKRNLSESQKGKVHTEEHRKNLSEAQRGNTNTLGHVLSEVHKRKISETLKGKHVGEGNPSVKLIKERVLMIRRMQLIDKYTQEILSKLFGVSRASISNIVNRKSWKHI